jgi:hypothetical protein
MRKLSIYRTFTKRRSLMRKSIKKSANGGTDTVKEGKKPRKEDKKNQFQGIQKKISVFVAIVIICCNLCLGAISAFLCCSCLLI